MAREFSKTMNLPKHTGRDSVGPLSKEFEAVICKVVRNEEYYGDLSKSEGRLKRMERRKAIRQQLNLFNESSSSPS